MQALGIQTNEYSGLEAIPLEFVVDRVTFESDEVTAICPVTSQRDFYQVVIALLDTQITIESKTLKLFFASLTNLPIFAELLPGYILAEICQYLQISPESYPATGPKYISVEVTQKPRGGITIEALASWTVSNPKGSSYE